MIFLKVYYYCLYLKSLCLWVAWVFLLQTYFGIKLKAHQELNLQIYMIYYHNCIVSLRKHKVQGLRINTQHCLQININTGPLKQKVSFVLHLSSFSSANSLSSYASRPLCPSFLPLNHQRISSKESHPHLRHGLQSSHPAHQKNQDLAYFHCPSSYASLLRVQNQKTLQPRVARCLLHCLPHSGACEVPRFLQSSWRVGYAGLAVAELKMAAGCTTWKSEQPWAIGVSSVELLVAACNVLLVASCHRKGTTKNFQNSVRESIICENRWTQ